MKVNTTAINYDNQQVKIPEEINSDMCSTEEVPLHLPQEQEPRPTRQKKPATRSEDFLWN